MVGCETQSILERWQQSVLTGQNLTMGEAVFNQFMRLRNQLVIAAENFAREENLSRVLIPTMFKDMADQLKLAHKAVDVVDRANRKSSVTLLRYNVDKPDSSYVQVQFFAKKKEDEKFQQVIYVNYKLEEFIYLPSVMTSVYDKVVTVQPLSNVLWKTSLFSLSFFVFFLESAWVGTLEIIETSLPSQNQNWDFIMFYLQLQKRLPKNSHYLWLKCSNCQTLKRLILKKK